MRKLTIPKKSGGKRTVYAPDWTEKARLRLLVVTLNRRVLKECDLDVTHGYVPGRSPITNALAHIGYTYTLTIDLKDFFDSIPVSMIEDLTPEEKKVCFIDGYLKQGLPTSPALSNLAMIKLDKDIKLLCNSANIKYTRYVDDLSFSGNDIEKIKRLLLPNNLPNMILGYGFQINPKKTRIQYANFGRRNITGVMVDDKRIYISRKTKRRLRAAIHQNRRKQINGLTEWSKLKTPTQNKRLTPALKVLARHLVRKFHDIPNVWH